MAHVYLKYNPSHRLQQLNFSCSSLPWPQPAALVGIARITKLFFFILPAEVLLFVSSFAKQFGYVRGVNGGLPERVLCAPVNLQTTLLG